MKIVISTKVVGNFKEIFKGFDLTLFEALAPPLIPAKVLQFDGCKKGDDVVLEIGALFKEQWHSKITDANETEKTIWFVDEGVTLPFPLKRWKHNHVLLNHGGLQTEIVDDIYYSTGLLLIDWAIYPFLYLMFWYRKPIYKKYFTNRFKSETV